MKKANKLRKILNALSPDEVLSEKFKAFDDDVAALKKRLVEKINVETVEDVRGQLAKFQKKIDFSGIGESLKALEEEVSKRSDVLASLIETTNNSATSKVGEVSGAVNNLSKELSEVRSELISTLDEQVAYLSDLNKQLDNKLAEAKRAGEEGKKTLKKIEERHEEDIKNVRKVIATSENLLRSELTDKEESLRRDMKRGGAAHLQVNVNSSVASRRYADINFLGNSAIRWVATDDDTNKRVDISASVIAGGAGGAGNPGGNDTEIQFNDGGSFGGASVFTWNKNTSVLALEGSMNITGNTDGVDFNAINITNIDGSANSDVRIVMRPANLSTARGVIETAAPGGSDTDINFLVSNNNGAPAQQLSIDGDGGVEVNNWLRVGSTTVPANTTAGDLTGVRLSLGNSPLTAGQRFVDVRGTSTTEANGAAIFANFINSIVPAADSLAEFRAINFQNTAGAADGINLDQIEGGHFEGARFGATQTGSIVAITGGVFWGAVPDSGATPLLNVDTIKGVNAFGQTRPSGTTSIIANEVYGVYATAINGGLVTTGSAVGVSVQNNHASTSILNAVGVDIIAQTRGTVDSIGLRVGKSAGATNNYAIHLSDTTSVAAGGITFGSDTTLYRGAVNQLKTDDALSVGTQGSVTGAIIMAGGVAQTTTIQPASTAGNWTLTLPANDGSTGQYLLTDGNGITQWASVTAVGGSGITRNVSIITADTTAADSASVDYVYFAEAGMRFTLPTAVGNTNLYTVKNNSNSSVLVIAPEGVDGSASALMPSNNESLSFISNNSIWGVV